MSIFNDDIFEVRKLRLQFQKLPNYSLSKIFKIFTKMNPIFPFSTPPEISLLHLYQTEFQKVSLIPQLLTKSNNLFQTGNQGIKIKILQKASLYLRGNRIAPKGEGMEPLVTGFCQPPERELCNNVS